MPFASRTLAFAAAAALSFAGLAAPSSAHGADWAIDGSHTNVGFKVKHLAVSWVRGNFSKAEGTISFDGKDLSTLKADVTIPIETVDTDNAKRDEHLRSPDFFDAANHPTMTFKSKKVTDISKDGTEFKLVGDLTIRGTTKEVTLEVEDWTAGVVDPWGNTKAGGTATTTINRFDFGLEWNNLLETGGLVVGEDVKIELELELNKKK